MIKFFQYIYSSYVAILFFLLLLLMLLLYVPLLLLRNDKTRMTIIYFINELFLRKIWATLVGIRIKVENRAIIKENQTYVFVANHSNPIDIPLMGSCINHYFKPLVKKELLSTPILGQLLRMTSLPVDRKSPESRKLSTEKMIAWLKGGLSLLIFPEGTRNRTPEPVKEFYDGAFKVAIAAQVSIAPVVMLNVRGLMEADGFLLKPGKVTVRFLPPVSTIGLTENDVELLKNKIATQMRTVLLQEDSFFTKK